MNRKKDQTALNDSQISFDDLRKKQSVRATFKLPQDVIDLLGVIAGQLGIKQKSLLDQLIEDKALLARLAQKKHQYIKDEAARRQKTFVISRSSLRSINDVAQKQNIPRDTLVEISIRRLLPIIETELEKHIIRKTLLKEMQNYLETGEKLYEKAHKLLGKDDVLSDMLEKQMSLAERNIATVAAIIEKGMPMEDW
jgi:hypothetical protein